MRQDSSETYWNGLGWVGYKKTVLRMEAVLNGSGSWGDVGTSFTGGFKQRLDGHLSGMPQREVPAQDKGWTR